MNIRLLIEGGNMKPGPALSQKVGPLGLNMGEIIQKVNDATKDFKGMKVPVELDVDATTKEFDVKVSSPPVSELLKKELGIEKGSGEQEKLRAANASIEQIILIAKTKFPNLLCKDLKAAVKTIVGSCVSLGLLIENKTSKEIEKEIDEGKYDKEISEEKIETSPEKRKKLDEYFDEFHAEQEKVKAEEEAAKAAAEEAKAEAAEEEEPVEGEEKPDEEELEEEKPEAEEEKK